MSLRLVLEDDGVEIDETFFATLEPNSKLVLIKEGENWSPRRGKYLHF